MQKVPEDDVLYSELCENGITITVFDRSRKIAADRWLVKVKCMVESGVVVKSCQAGASGPEFVGEESSKTEIPKTFSKVFWRERNFIDDKEREHVLADLVQQMKETVFPYLRRGKTAEKLRNPGSHPHDEPASRKDSGNPFAHLDQDDGPADFSSLFRK